MRTVRSLTERDGPLWRVHCPMLDGLSRALGELLRSAGAPVAEEPLALTPSDLALCSFELFARWSTGEGEMSASRAANLLVDEGYLSAADGELQHDAIVVSQVAKNMRSAGRALRLRGVPSVRADLTPCGVVESAHCDAIWSEHLVEFKSVRRSLGVRDLRQVVLYAVLASLGAGGTISHVVLSNPLSAEYVSLPIDELARVISGVPFETLARDIADYLVGLGISG